MNRNVARITRGAKGGAGAVAVVALVTMGLTACGSSTNGEGEKKVIHFSGNVEPTIDEQSAARFTWIEGAIAQFEEEFPDFEVRYQSYQGSQIDASVIRDFQSGGRQDVVMIESGRIARHADAGSLLDLTDIYAAWPEETRNELDWLADLEYVMDEGQFYSLPAVMHARAIAYRKDLFREAGLDPEQPPQTLEELVEYAKALTGDGVHGLGLYLGNHAAAAELYMSPYLWHFGGDFLDENKMATFAEPPGIQAAQFIADLVNVHEVTPASVVSGDYVDSITSGFLNGSYAMAEGFGNYFFSSVQASEFANEVGYFRPPIEQRFVNHWGLGIFADTEFPEESARLLEILMTPEHLVHFDYGLPVHESAYETPAFEYEGYATMRESAAAGRTMRSTIHYDELTGAVSAAIQEIVINGSDPAETLLRYQEEYNASFGGE